MSLNFVIEDESHAEQLSRHRTLADAEAELQRLAAVPWDQEPNRAPCTNWRNCGRRYEVVEYDTSGQPGSELRRLPVLEISAAGARWTGELPR